MAAGITTPEVPHTARQKEENIVLTIDGINQLHWTRGVVLLKGANNVPQSGLSLTT